jgi:tetratricopeptide (TPR) repeat protein
MFKKISGIKYKLSSRRKIASIVASVLIVAGIITAGWFLWLQPYLNKVNTPPLTAEEVYNKLYDSTSDKLANNDYSGAMSSIDVAIANANTESDKSRLYILKYITAFGISKYDEAYASALKAEELLPTSSTAVLIGDCLLEMKQNDKAVEYYNKALSRIDIKSEFDSSDAINIQQKILKAQGKSTIDE